MLDAVELDVQMFNRNVGTWDHETGFSRIGNMAYDVLFKMFAHTHIYYIYIQYIYIYMLCNLI